MNKALYITLGGRKQQQHSNFSPESSYFKMTHDLPPKGAQFHFRHSFLVLPHIVTSSLFPLPQPMTAKINYYQVQNTKWPPYYVWGILVIPIIASNLYMTHPMAFQDHTNDIPWHLGIPPLLHLANTTLCKDNLSLLLTPWVGGMMWPLQVLVTVPFEILPTLRTDVWTSFKSFKCNTHIFLWRVSQKFSILVIFVLIW